jgi:hypothetical protein
MRWRLVCVLLIMAAGISLRSVQPASAAINCKTDVKYVFPSDWYTITAKKTWPEKPIVKQQLEDLAARGDLPNPPSYYDAKFSIQVSLKPGIAWWETVEKELIWGDDPKCPLYQKLNHTCRQVVVDTVEYCLGHNIPVYRSIQEIAFSLIPDGQTAAWYTNLSQSPTVNMLYPNFWEPVVLGNNGQPQGNFWGDLNGPHFFFSDPLAIGMFHYPSKLPQIAKEQALINQADIQNVDQEVRMVIPVCTILTGSQVEHGPTGATVVNYGYNTDNTWVNSDIDADPYYCAPIPTFTDSKIQSIDLEVVEYDFDFPANFYLGVVTKIAPALSPIDGISKETDITETGLEPSNIFDNSYRQTQFSVWMLVSTPCQTADNGCDTLTPPGQ